ncbi:MAG: UbiA family prenyltransferase, partial [Nocardioides sp.]
RDGAPDGSGGPDPVDADLAPDPTTPPGSASSSGPAAGPVAGPVAGPPGSPVADPASTEPPAAATDRTLLQRVLDSTPLTLFLAAHPRQAIATAVILASAALVSGRPVREAAIVLVTVLVGQAILGWHNDLVDRERDAKHRTPRKPIAEGRLDPGSVWYALIIALLLVIPLSISVGVTAGTFYLASLVIGILGNVVLRRGRASPLPWMASFALYPFYLSYGGYGGAAEGDAPQVAVVVVSALLGIGVHFLRAIWGLVEDDQDGWTYLPLVLGRRLGATRLLQVSTAYTAAVVALLVILGSSIGLRQ